MLTKIHSKYHHINIHYYDKDQSHLETNSFIQIFNSGTVEFTSQITKMFKTLSFHKTLKVINDLTGEKVSSRGNVQVNTGYTGVNYDREQNKKKDGIQRPALLKDTSEHHLIKMMLNMSTLISNLTTGLVFSDNGRNDTFAKRIPEMNGYDDKTVNIIEGYTASYTTRKKRVKGHVDQMNDPGEVYNTVVCSS